MIYLNFLAANVANLTGHDGHQGPFLRCRGTLRLSNDCSGDLMYYVILFIGVLSFLTLVALLDPSGRKTLTLAGRQGTGRGDHAVDAAGDFVARLLRGERREDKPCLTPIDCVRLKRCDGHCGSR